ncbi:MAG: hypothetical protein H7Y86_20710 [Rhizobacter sp.]|nr:hypothetical protein [Ferruginibacter sp.]
MKKLLTAFTLLFLSIPVCFSQATLVQQSILNGKVEILLPGNFKQQENPGNTNASILSDNTGSVSLAYEWQDETMTDNDIPAYTDVLISEMKKNKMPHTFLDDGIHLQDGKNIGYIKLSTEESGKKLFTYLFYISVADKLLYFAFTCPLNERKKWEADADKIANSLRIK